MPASAPKTRIRPCSLPRLKKAGCKTVFKDEVTGAHVNRPALTRCLKTLQTGDTLIVWKLDRLGRSLRDLIHMLDDFKQQRHQVPVTDRGNRHRDADRPRHVADDWRAGRA